MSMMLSKVLVKRGKGDRAAQMGQEAEEHEARHIIEHEIVDRYHGHDHGEGHKKHHEVKSGTRIPTTTPSFLLNLWAALPLLLLSFGNTIMWLAITATLVNFFIIQMRVHTSKRYIASGVVSFMVLCAYLVTS